MYTAHVHYYRSADRQTSRQIPLLENDGPGGGRAAEGVSAYTKYNSAAVVRDEEERVAALEKKMPVCVCTCTSTQRAKFIRCKFKGSPQCLIACRGHRAVSTDIVYLFALAKFPQCA